MQNKLFSKKIILSTALSSLLLAAPFCFSACRGGAEETNTDSSIVDSSTKTTDGSTNSSTDSSMDTSTDDKEPETDVSFEQFIEENTEIAETFAEEIYSQISYIKDSLSTHYSFVEKDGKIEKVIVANVVKTGETERQLKIATINIVPSVDVEDLVEDNVDEIAVAIQTETVMTFDAKENYKNDTFELVEEEIAQLVEQHLGDQTFTAQEYQEETFLPQSVEELVNEYPEKVNEILNETCFDAIIKRCVTINYDQNNIISAKWYLEGENEITGVGLLVHYNDGDGYKSYRYGKATLKDSVSIADFINKQNIEIEKTSREYRFGFIAEEQGTRDDLVNAIFEANGMSGECPEGAIRVMKDNGYQVDTIGETNEFVVAEISNNGIIQFGVEIKQSSDDQGYINNLKNSSNFRICDTYNENVTFTGEQINCFIPTVSNDSIKVDVTGKAYQTENISIQKKEELVETVLNNI